jgi:hypothetical protein
MSDKKSIAKKPSKRKTATREENRRRLAADLARVLANPETPEGLYNAIADQHSTWESEIKWHEAPELLRALNNYARKEAERTGGRS